MFTEARKLRLIEGLLKLNSENALVQIERILNISKSKQTVKRPSAHGFLGKVSSDDIKLMNQAIEEGCEQIDPNDWQ